MARPADNASDLERYPYLAGLNSAQLQAVTAPPHVPLQILAGPGSGKTRVLTSRVAHLVRCHGLSPRQITAVTFTNKAATEMKKRLEVLLGKPEAGRLVLGTFHATCARYLRRYGSRIGLNNNFAIADADDCKKIMARLLKARAEELAELHMSLKEPAVLSEISKAKAKEETPRLMARRAARDQSQETSTLAVIAELYKEYEEALRKAGALDFDDLLLVGLRLFRECPDILESCHHILVDEFQDTNITQYELMKCFAKAHGGVSIVGDPDQSIYGWRSAEVENLDKMRSHFKGVTSIFLEENYRSTGAILAASHSIVSQDPKRIPKSLFTSHPKSTPVTLKQFMTPTFEANFISAEIKRMIAHSGGLLKHDDFAILLRYNALSRIIEASLQKERIPCRIVGGQKFFDRMEIKDLLAYLQLADNPTFTPAFHRVVNVPRRAMGDKSVADLMAAAQTAKIAPMELAERIVDSDKPPPGIKTATKKNLTGFVQLVRQLRQAALVGTPVDELIRLVLDKTGYEPYLRSTQQDFDQRWENVQELINYSVSVAQGQEQAEATAGGADGMGEDVGFVTAAAAMLLPPEPETQPRVAPHPMFWNQGPSAERRQRTKGEDGARVKDEANPGDSVASDSAAVPENWVKAEIKAEAVSATLDRSRVKIEVKQEAQHEVIEILDSDDDFEEIEPPRRAPHAALDEGGLTPLRFFLQSSMLSTDTETGADTTSLPKVTISTVHASKGLEWPVVFIPAAEQGTFPSYRCLTDHEVAEERRLLYVAMTRAQSFLTITHCWSRMSGGEDKERDLSEFIVKSRKDAREVFTADLPEIDAPLRQQLSRMLSRPAPDEAVAQELITRHVRTAPPPSAWNVGESHSKGSSRFGGKQRRGAEYWGSGHDDYALPDPASDSGPSHPGFVFSSALSTSHHPRTRAPATSAPPKPPPQRIQSANRNLPPQVPFTFMGETRPAVGADLGSFTNSSKSSLDAMKALGLSADLPAAARPAHVAASAPLAAPGAGTVAPASGGAPVVPLARGAKRLGMGRPMAPWGAKRSKS